MMQYVTRSVLSIVGLSGALLSVSCQEVVTTVGAARVDVSPTATNVRVTETTRLSVAVLSQEGRVLSGRTIVWSTAEPTIASVDETGMVRGLAPGVATIRAAADGALGSAVVTVTPGPTLSVSPDEVEIIAVQNGATPGDRTVTVANAGDGTLTGLTRTIRYTAGQPTNWLSVNLPSAAPAAMVLSANPASLPLGTYTATVDVASPDAGNSPVPVTVRLLVVAPQPAISLGATSASFAAAQGGANPAQQEIGVTNAGGGTLSGLSATVTYSSGQPGGWLTASLSAATAPSTLVLRPTTGALTPGSYTATVQVGSATAQNSPQLVNVTFTVGGPQPLIAVDPSTLSFTASKGGSNPATQVVQISNSAGGSLGPLAISVTYPGGQPAGWLTTSLSGTSPPATVTVGVAIGALDVGTYTATISVTSPNATNSPRSIDVTFVVSSPPPIIAVAPQQANFSTTITAGDPAPAQIAITNAGTATLSGLTRVVSYTTGQPVGWLEATLTATSAPTTLTLVARNGSLGVGSYSAKVQLAAPAASNSPIDIDVTFTIAAAAPTAPSQMTAAAQSDRRIDVSWTDLSNNESRFDIERNAGAGWTPAGTTAPNQRTFSDSSGLAGSTTYSYRVSACNAFGCSTSATAASATTAPTAPSGTTATAVAAGQINVSWADNSPDETAFPVERSTDGGQTWGVVQTAAPGVTSYTDANVLPNTTYRYRVRACRGALCSSYSNQAQAMAGTPPSVPAGLTATPASSTRIDVSWQAPPETVTGYTVQRRVGSGAWTSVGSAPSGQTAFADNGVQPSTTYGYRVQACNVTLCSAFSGEVLATTPAPPPPPVPSAPGVLQANAVSSSRIDLAWGPSTGSVIEYRIEAMITGSGTFAPAGSVPGGTTTAQITGLAPQTSYTFQVQACNSTGCSAHSNQAAATTPAAPVPPSVPSGVGANVVSHAQIDVSWQAPPETVTSYNVERRIGSGAWGGIGGAPSGQTTLSDNGVQPSTTYGYRVQACNGALCSAFSGEVVATTPAAPPPPVPGAPAGLSASAVSTTQINLAWGASTGIVTDYRIEAMVTGSGTFAPAGSVAGGTTSAQITGLTPQTSYTYQVQACNSTGCSAFSNAATATTPAPAPSTPGASAGNATATQITVSWSYTGPQVDQFEVQRATAAGGPWSPVFGGPGTASSFTDSGLNAATTYYYQVRACNVAGCSAWAAASATTQPPAAPTGVTGVRTGLNQITVSWQASPGATSYILARRDGTGGFTDIGSVSGTSFQDNSAVPLLGGGLYRYQIRACANNVCSSASQTGNIL